MHPAFRSGGNAPYPAPVRQLTGAGLCALLCVLGGRLIRKKWEDQLKETLLFQDALQSLFREMRFSGRGLAALFMACAPDEHHYFFRLGREMASHPAAPPDELLQALPPPALLSPALQKALEKLLFGLMLPEETWQQKTLEETLLFWKEETLALQAHLSQKGPLITQLSLYLGCALFILLC